MGFKPFEYLGVDSFLGIVSKGSALVTGASVFFFPAFVAVQLAPPGRLLLLA